MAGHYRCRSGGHPVTATQPVKADVDPESIVIDPEFTARQYDLITSHIRNLAQVVRNGQPLDRVLLWRDPSAGANALTLLDGAYRLAAYKLVGWPGSIPATILECSRKDALLRAAGANSKDRLGLCRNEKQDQAWKLVRAKGVTFSIAELARATSVSPRNIVRMRNRWRELQGRPEATVTGRWWQDQKDEAREWQDVEDMHPAERKAAIDDMVAKVRDLMDRRKGSLILADSFAVYEIVGTAFGASWVEGFAEWYLGGKEEAAEWMTGNPDAGDDNPDF
jgi:hypothetical protein